MPRDYDVFISYNSEDKLEAQALNRLLVEQIGLRTWFDDQDMVPGDSIIQSIEEGISQALTCLILVGATGQGTWQRDEVRAALQRQIEQSYFRVIPVLLPSATTEPNWPIFLRGKLWIDLRKDYFDGLRKLFHAIRGKSGVALYPQVHQEISIDEDEADVRPDDENLPAGYTADVTKIVELLIGESLYSRKDVCVRELIQNAVDACQRRKARVMTSYEPEVFLRINSKEGWFEVDDNGEGMSPDLFRNSFAIIGKSIRDDEGLIQLINEKRAYVIAKFGIGFVSTFMISNRVIISTTFEGEYQINLSITAFNERFSYTDSTECHRDPEKVGTTVRVYLSREHLKLDVLNTASRYLRHVPYCHIVSSGIAVNLKEDWNIETAIITEIVKSKSGSYELRWGASPDEGSFVASNWGFLIGEKVDPVLPFFTPSWITGEIYFLPGVIDLTVARDAVVANDKASRIKQEMQRHLRRFLYNIANKVDIDKQETEVDDFSRYSDKPQLLFEPLRRKRSKDSRKTSIIKQKMEELCMVYNYCLRNPKEYNQESSESPPLSLEETNELILDLIHFKYGAENNFLSLREILNDLRKHKISKAYYQYSWYSGFLPFLGKLLAGKGFLVFNVSRIKVFLRGSNKGAIEAYNTNILSPILKEQGIELQDIKDVPPEEIDILRVAIGSLPKRIASALDRERKRGTKLALVSLPEAEIVFRRDEVRYLNTAHPLFLEFIEWSNAATDNEIRLFVNGLLQTVP